MNDIFNERRKRLRLLINTLIIKDKEFAKSLGKEPAVVSQLLNGYRKISADFAFEVGEVYPWLNPEWLISGKVPMRRDELVVENYQIETSPRALNDLESDYRADPLAGLRDVVRRLEELEAWKDEASRELAELRKSLKQE